MVAFNESGKYRRVLCTTFNLEAVSQFNIDDSFNHRPVRNVHVYLEVAPTTGRRHYHMYIEFTKQATLSQIKRLFGDETMNIEPAFGTAKDAAEYFKKEGSVWDRKYGSPSKQGQRTDMQDIYERLKVGEDLLDIIQDHPGSGIRYCRGLSAVKSPLDQKRQRLEERVMPEAIVYLGKSGSGKSHHCWNDPAYQQSGYKYPVQQNGKVHFDGYGGKVLSRLTSLGEASFPSTYSCDLQTSMRPESRPREEASASSGCARSSSPRPSSPKTGGQSTDIVKRYRLSFVHFLPSQCTSSRLSGITSLQSNVLVNSNPMHISLSTRGNTFFQ